MEVKSGACMIRQTNRKFQFNSLIKLYLTRASIMRKRKFIVRNKMTTLLLYSIFRQ